MPRKYASDLPSAKTDLANFATALSMFQADTGSYPNARDGLRALLVPPSDVRGRWKGPYLDVAQIPPDPWKNPYVYEIPGQHNPKGYDLYSKGRDGLGGTNTIGNWGGP